MFNSPLFYPSSKNYSRHPQLAAVIVASGGMVVDEDTGILLTSTRLLRSGLCEAAPQDIPFSL